MTWTTCFSEEAEAWLCEASKAKGTEAHAASIRFRELVQHRLEPFGPFGAELATLKKIHGVDGLWELRQGAYRMFMSFASGQRIVISSIVEKRRGNFPQSVYKREERKVSELIELANAGRLGC